MIYLAAMITNSADNNETIRFNEIKPIISPTLCYFTVHTTQSDVSILVQTQFQSIISLIQTGFYQHIETKTWEIKTKAQPNIQTEMTGWFLHYYYNYTLLLLSVMLFIR